MSDTVEIPSTVQHDGPAVKLEQFEGPLDLLIFLIRKNEVNIYDIPIARITKQYLEFLEYAIKVDLNTITEFYVMAATLLYIKSRMLLPAPEADTDDFDDPRQELVDRLIEYQRYRKLTDLMTEQAESNETVLERRKAQPVLPFPDEEDIWDQIDVWDLLKTFSSVVSSISPDRLINLYEEVSVNEKLTLISEYADNQEFFSFDDLIKKADSIMEIVCAFIAILEAVRQKTVRIMQSRMFGDIRIQAVRNDGTRESSN